MQHLRIAQLGTFDLDNLGDLLFPLVLNEWLRKLEAQLQISVHCDLFGLKGVSASVIYPDQAGCYPMTSFAEMDRAAPYDLVFIGGGDIIRDDDDMLPQIYATQSPQFSYPSLLSPSASPEKRLVLLAAGAPFPFSEACQLFLANSFHRLLRASVRDTHTSDLLAPLVPDDVDIEIVPDIVNSIATLYPRANLGAGLPALLPEECLRKGYVCFQVRHGFLDEYRQIGEYLRKFQRETGLAVVLLEIGRCLGDDEILGRIASEFDFPYVKNDGTQAVSIMDKVAVVAYSQAFIGTSLHGNIIASAYNIPHFTFGNSQLKKIGGFFDGRRRGHAFPSIHELDDVATLHGLITGGEPLSDEELGASSRRIHDFLTRSFTAVLSAPEVKATAFSPATDRVFLALNDERLRQRSIIAHFDSLAQENDGYCSVLQQKNTELRTKADRLETALRAANIQHQSALAEGHARLSELERQLSAAEGETKACREALSARGEELAARAEELAAIRNEMAALRGEMAAVFASMSWRATKPLRYIRGKFV